MSNKQTQKDIISMLVRGYVSNNSCIYMPSHIVNIIYGFHGLYNIDFESNILTTIFDKILLMTLIVNELPNNCIKLYRLYSGKNDGFKARIFHCNCDYKGPTISIIKNEYNVIFGGYTSISWTMNNRTNNDKYAFLFQLYPNKKIFKQRNKNGHKSVYHWHENMCSFSGNCDLKISTNCNSNYASYSNPKYYLFKNGTDLVGGPINHNNNSNNNDSNDTIQRFMVNEIEVYQVISSQNIYNHFYSIL